MPDEQSLIPAERIDLSILRLRGQKVILDRDLAALYGVLTRNLNKAVSRNLDRFPKDFMFQLSKEELSILKFQFGTSRWGGTRKPPRAFTEQGVAMLSSVLRSKRAVHVNIEIMRAFVRLRRMLASNADLARKLDELEKKYDKQFQIVFEAIRKLALGDVVSFVSLLGRPSHPGWGRGGSLPLSQRSLPYPCSMPVWQGAHYVPESPSPKAPSDPDTLVL